MSENNKNINNENEEEMAEIFTLTDEEGNEIEFEVVADYEKDGQRYFAMIPLDDDENTDDDICEYVILKLAVEDGEEVLVTVDDDDELDDVADYFDDLFSQIDYDN